MRKITILKDTSNKLIESKDELMLDENYAQVYKEMYKSILKLKRPMSFQLIHWILTKMDKENVIVLTNVERARFCVDCIDGGGPEYQPRSVERAIAELLECGVINRISRSHYQVSAFLAWKDSLNSRYKYIKAQLELESELPRQIHSIEVKQISKIAKD